ncbi:MAG: hypothetical protein ACOYD6_02300 [Limnochordia bacterium]
MVKRSIGATWVLTIILAVSVNANELPSTHFSASVVRAVELVDWVNQEIHLPDLVPGREVVSEPIHLEVRSNSSWVIYLGTENGESTFSEYDVDAGGYTYAGEKLSNPVLVSVNGGNWFELNGEMEPILPIMPKTGPEGEHISIRIKVNPSWEDKILTPGRVYRLGLVYSIGPSL